jgi:hypothetical protein
VIPEREMAQLPEVAEIRPLVTCDHRPGTIGLLTAALSGAIVGALVVLALTLLAAPRSAAQATAGFDVSPGLSPARLTGAPGSCANRGAPSGRQEAVAAQPAASSDPQALSSLASRP